MALFAPCCVLLGLSELPGPLPRPLQGQLRQLDLKEKHLGLCREREHTNEEGQLS